MSPITQPGEDDSPSEDEVKELVANTITDIFESNRGYFYKEEEIIEELAERWDLDNITSRGSNTPRTISDDLKYNYLGQKVEELLDDLEMHNQAEVITDKNGIEHYGIE